MAKNARFSISPLALASIVAVLAVIAAFIIGRQSEPKALAANAAAAQMPTLLGSPLASAKARLGSMSPPPKYTTRIIDYAAPTGTIVAQIPAPGSPVPQGALVTLVASDGVAPRNPALSSSSGRGAATGIEACCTFYVITHDS